MNQHHSLLFLNQCTVVHWLPVPTPQKVIFASRAKGTPEPRDVKKLIVMLLCAEIITYRISYASDDLEKRNPLVLARLNHYENGALYLNDDSRCWRLIPSKEAIPQNPSSVVA